MRLQKPPVQPTPLAAHADRQRHARRAGARTTIGFHVAPVAYFSHGCTPSSTLPHRSRQFRYIRLHRGCVGAKSDGSINARPPKSLPIREFFPSSRSMCSGAYRGRVRGVCHHKIQFVRRRHGTCHLRLSCHDLACLWLRVDTTSRGICPAGQDVHNSAAHIANRASCTSHLVPARTRSRSTCRCQRPTGTRTRRHERPTITMDSPRIYDPPPALCAKDGLSFQPRWSL